MNLTRTYLRKRFERIADIMDWNIHTRFDPKSEGTSKLVSVPGYVMMEKNAYKGYDITEVVSETGAEKTLFHASTKVELDAWFSGVEFGYDSAHS